jgi:DNA polymerase-3 subunit gamma/tau
MSVLRMLAFRPANAGDVAPAGAAPARATGSTGTLAPVTGQAAAASSAAAARQAPVAPEAATAPPPVEKSKPEPAADMPMAVGKPADLAPEQTPPWDVPMPKATVAPPAADVPVTAAPPPAPASVSDEVPPWEVPAQHVVVSTPPVAALTDVDRAPVHDPMPRGVAEIADADHWLALVASAQLTGPSKQLAANAAFSSYGDAVLRLSLAAGFEYLRTDRSIGDLAQALSSALGHAPKIVFEAVADHGETLAQRDARAQDARKSSAEDNFMNHPDVQRLIQQQGARVVPDSIRPFDE